MQKIQEVIKKGQNFLVMGHRNVDGDAYGSSMALYFYLQGLGKTVEVVNDFPITPLFYFLGVHDRVHKEITGKNFDAIFVCDCGELSLVGKYPEQYSDIFEHTPIVNIDHHNGNKMFGTYNLVDTEASSTCEILSDLIGEELETFQKRSNLNEKGDPEGVVRNSTMNEEAKFGIQKTSFSKVSTLLLFGIIRDTNCFKNSLRPNTFAATSRLLDHGADYDRIIFHSYKSEKLNYLKLYGHVLENLISLKGGTIVGGCISQEIFERYSIPESELGPQLINEILSSIEGVDFAFLIKETESGERKLSFRARRDGFDVSKIAGHFGGGGHIQSAGAYTSESIEEILKVIGEIDTRI